MGYSHGLVLAARAKVITRCNKHAPVKRSPNEQPSTVVHGLYSRVPPMMRAYGNCYGCCCGGVAWCWQWHACFPTCITLVPSKNGRDVPDRVPIKKLFGAPFDQCTI